MPGFYWNKLFVWILELATYFVKDNFSFSLFYVFNEEA